MSLPTKSKISKTKTSDKSSSFNEGRNNPGALEFSRAKGSGNAGHIKQKGEKKEI